MTAQVSGPDRHFALSEAKKASAPYPMLASDLGERLERSTYAKATADNLRPDALLTRGKRVSEVWCGRGETTEP